MLAVSSLQQPDTQNALAEKMQLPNGADVPETIAQLPDEARRQIMEQMTEKLDGMPESIVTQGAMSLMHLCATLSEHRQYQGSAHIKRYGTTWYIPSVPAGYHLYFW